LTGGVHLGKDDGSIAEAKRTRGIHHRCGFYACRLSPSAASTPENGSLLIEFGADLLAVIGGVFGTGDPEQAALAFKPLFPPD